MRAGVLFCGQKPGTFRSTTIICGGTVQVACKTCEKELKDLEEIDPMVRKALNFITAQTVDTVLEAALNCRHDLAPTILGNLPEEIKNKANKPSLRQ